MSYLEKRLYSEAFEDGMNYAIEKMYAFTEFNKRAWNAKLELAKKGKLKTIRGWGKNHTNELINDMADAIKKGDRDLFNLAKRDLENYNKASKDGISRYDEALKNAKSYLEELRNNRKSQQELQDFHF